MHRYVFVTITHDLEVLETEKEIFAKISTVNDGWFTVVKCSKLASSSKH